MGLHYYDFCPKEEELFKEAYTELDIINPEFDYSYTIFPKRFYKQINFTNSKKYNFVFIGGLLTDNETSINRKWILPFIQDKFDDNSYLQFTDCESKQRQSMGCYDYTNKKNGFVPKLLPTKDQNYFDNEYFSTMTNSKFCLCPAGDSFYSMRFYEALMCKCIPIVNTIDETFRSEAESKLDYKYYLSSENEFVYSQEWADHNYKLFMRYHTLEYGCL